MVLLKDNVALTRTYAACHSHAPYSLLCAILSSSFVCQSQKHSIDNDQVKPLENLHLVITEMLECIIDQIYVIDNYYYQVNLMIATLHLMQEEQEIRKISHSCYVFLSTYVAYRTFYLINIYDVSKHGCMDNWRDLSLLFSAGVYSYNID